MSNINSVNNRFLNQPVTSTATSYTALPSDVIIEATAPGITITLPTPVATGNVGKAFIIKDSSGNASVNNIVITPASGTIDGVASAYILTNYGSTQVFCDGTNYYTYGLAYNTGSFAVKEQVFTSSGTYTPTTGMLYCEIDCVGGGGGGGATTTTTVGTVTAAGGGGGGGYARKTLQSTAVGSSQTITIGSGGSAGIAPAGNGGTGGSSSFGSLVASSGGAGGVGGALAPTSQGYTANGGIGGTGTTGDILSYGAGGGAGFASETYSCLGGAGGSSYFGGGASSSATFGTPESFPGNNYGGGGSGCATGGGGNNQGNGGLGAPGAILVTEYIALSSPNLPVVSLAYGSWTQFNSGTPVSGQSTPDPTNSSSSVTPFAASSRLNFAPTTTNYVSGMTVGTNFVTINQTGLYRVVLMLGVDSGNSGGFIQIVKNSTSVIGYGEQYTSAGQIVSINSSEVCLNMAVGDTIDFRWSIGSGIYSINITIQQLPSSVIVPVTAWYGVAGTSKPMVPNAGYYTQNSSLTTLTLPIAAFTGTTLQVAGAGSGGWTIAQNTGQSINLGNQATTVGTGGSLSSTNQYDGITLLCVGANTNWVGIGATGNLAVV